MLSWTETYRNFFEHLDSLPIYIAVQGSATSKQCIIITIGRYETLSLHTVIEMLSGSQVSNCCGQGLGSDPNGALTQIDHIPKGAAIDQRCKTICWRPISENPAVYVTYSRIILKNILCCNMRFKLRLINWWQYYLVWGDWWNPNEKLHHSHVNTY